MYLRFFKMAKRTHFAFLMCPLAESPHQSHESGNSPVHGSPSRATRVESRRAAHCSQVNARRPAEGYAYNPCYLPKDPNLPLFSQGEKENTDSETSEMGPEIIPSILFCEQRPGKQRPLQPGRPAAPRDCGCWHLFLRIPSMP